MRYCPVNFRRKSGELEITGQYSYFTSTGIHAYKHTVPGLQYCAPGKMPAGANASNSTDSTGLGAGLAGLFYWRDCNLLVYRTHLVDNADMETLAKKICRV